MVGFGVESVDEEGEGEKVVAALSLSLFDSKSEQRKKE